MSFSLSASLLEISASDVSQTADCSPFELQAVSIIAATAQIVKMIALDFINILLNKQNNYRNYSACNYNTMITICQEK